MSRAASWPLTILLVVACAVAGAYAQQDVPRGGELPGDIWDLLQNRTDGHYNTTGRNVSDVIDDIRRPARNMTRPPRPDGPGPRNNHTRPNMKDHILNHTLSRNLTRPWMNATRPCNGSRPTRPDLGKMLKDVDRTQLAERLSACDPDGLLGELDDLANGASDLAALVSALFTKPWPTGSSVRACMLDVLNDTLPALAKPPSWDAFRPCGASSKNSTRRPDGKGPKPRFPLGAAQSVLDTLTGTLAGMPLEDLAQLLDSVTGRLLALGLDSDALEPLIEKLRETAADQLTPESVKDLLTQAGVQLDTVDTSALEDLVNDLITVATATIDEMQAALRSAAVDPLGPIVDQAAVQKLMERLRDAGVQVASMSPDAVNRLVQSLNLPNQLPKIDLPNVDLPNVDLPDINLPDLDLEDLKDLDPQQLVDRLADAIDQATELLDQLRSRLGAGAVESALDDPAITAANVEQTLKALAALAKRGGGRAWGRPEDGSESPAEEGEGPEEDTEEEEETEEEGQDPAKVADEIKNAVEDALKSGDAGQLGDKVKEALNGVGSGSLADKLKEAFGRGGHRRLLRGPV